MISPVGPFGPVKLVGGRKEALDDRQNNALLQLTTDGRRDTVTVCPSIPRSRMSRGRALLLSLTPSGKSSDSRPAKRASAT